MDDDHDDGLISRFRKRLEGELRLQVGRRDVQIFQDLHDMTVGPAWKEQLKNKIDAASLCLAIVTPAFLSSPHCRWELEQFLERERQLHRNDLVLPVYWIKIPEWEEPGGTEGDELAERHRADWRELRFDRNLNDPKWLRQMHALAEQILRVLKTLPQPEPPPDDETSVAAQAPPVEPSSGGIADGGGPPKAPVNDAPHDQRDDRLTEPESTGSGQPRDPDPPENPPAAGMEPIAAAAGRGRRMGSLLPTDAVSPTDAVGVAVEPPPTPDEPRRRIRFPAPAGWRRTAVFLAPPLVVAVVLAVAFLRPSSEQSTPMPCDSQYMVLRGSECIGVRKDRGWFTVDPREDDPQDRQIAEIWGKIVDENKAVEARSASDGKPYATIIVAARLSSEEDLPHQDFSVLASALLAMQEWNREPIHPFLIRIWAANLGGHSDHLVEAADIIRAVADDPEDRSVVAVTALGRTLRDSATAIDRIGGPTDGSPGVPMVAATQSGDLLTGRPNYFRVAAPDQRQAAVGMIWALANRPGVQPYFVHIWGDPYSEGLAENYRRAAQAAGIERPVRSISYSTEGPDAGHVLGLNEDEIEKKMCDPVGVENAPRLVVYTGRISDLHLMLGELNRTTCREDITVLGGDALAGVKHQRFSEAVWNELHPRENERPRVRLMNVTFGPESLEARVPLATAGSISSGWDDFFETYTGLNDGLPEDLRLPGDPATGAQTAYDAVTLVVDALERAYRCNHPDSTLGRESCPLLEKISTAARGAPVPAEYFASRLPDRPQVYAALRLTTGSQKYTGLAGVIDFGTPPDAVDGEGADPMEKLIVIHEVTTDADGQVVFGYVCSAAAGKSDCGQGSTTRP